MGDMARILTIINRIDTLYGYWKLVSGKYRFEISLWSHSVNTGAVACMIADLLGLPDILQETALLAGMLHDYAKSGEARDPVEELGRVLGDLIDEAHIRLASAIASHAEAGPQSIPPRIIADAGIDPYTYTLLSDIVSISDAIASMGNIIEAEKALIIRDEDYWKRLHRWERYLKILERLSGRGLRFYTISYTHYTAPYTRALILWSLAKNLLGSTLKHHEVFFNDGVLVMTNREMPRIEITRSLVEKVVEEILDFLGRKPVKYMRPNGKIISFEQLISEKDLEAIVSYYKNMIGRLEGKARREAEEENAAKLAKDLYDTALWSLPREEARSIPRPAGVKTLEEFREYAYGFIGVKRRLDKERITDYLWRIIFPIYLSGSLIEQPKEKAGDGSGYCYTCGNPLPKKDSYPLISALLLPVGQQVKYWLPHIPPLKNLDNYTAKGKFRVCPVCYLELMVMAKMSVRPPLLYILDYPVSTLILAYYQKILMDYVISDMIKRALAKPVGLVWRLNKFSPTERSIARKVVGAGLLKDKFIKNIAVSLKEPVSTRSIDEWIHENYPIIMETVGGKLGIGDIRAELMDLEESEIFEDMIERILLLYNSIIVYSLSAFLSVGRIDALNLRRASYEASRSVTIGLAPLAAVASILTGGSVRVSEHLDLSPPSRIIELPHDVYGEPRLYDMRSGRPVYTPLHLLLYSGYLSLSMHIYSRLRRKADLSREYLRFYSLLESSPLVFMGASSILYRIVSSLDRMPSPRDPRLGEFEELLRLLEVISRVSRDGSGELLGILDEVIDYLDKVHNIQSWSKYSFIAPLTRSFESLYKKLALVDELGEEAVVSMAAAEFLERIRRDTEYIKAEDLARGEEKVKELLRFILKLYRERRDAGLIRDLVNDIYNYVFIKRYIRAAKRAAEKKKAK